MVEFEIGLYIVCWFLGFYFFFKIRKPDLSSNSASVTISVIIPARNEEHNLPHILDSLRQQTLPPFQIIVANDESTDQTEQIAASMGARVIHVQKTDDTWTGKTKACFQAAEQAKSDFFLFVDADVVLENNCLSTLQVLLNSYVGPSSFIPYHQVKKSYENLSAIFNLFMIAGTGSSAIFNRTTKLVGQALLISKDHYFAVGGHYVVKDEILENISLSNLFHAKNIPTFTYDGKGLFSMRMFPKGTPELIQSWTKGFVTGAGKTPGDLMTAMVLWIFGGLSVLLHFFWSSDISAHVAIALISILIMYVFQIRWMLRKIGSYPWVTSILYPYYMFFFIGLFFYSSYLKIRGRKIIWKNRYVG